MRDKKWWLLVLLLIATFFLISKRISFRKSYESTHPLVFFDQGSFYTGVTEIKEKEQTFNYSIRGGIVPHHTFPSFIIANFFSRLSKQNPTTVFIIGPNHYERGGVKPLTSLYGWETPFGVVEPDGKIIRKLMEESRVVINEDVLSKDQSATSLMPFLKYYLPEVKVVPILLSGFMTQSQIQELASCLKGYLNNDVAIVAAVDFSHNLTSPEAKEKDNLTLEVMQSFNYQKLLTLGNDYLDSPSSIAALLMMMQAQGATKTEILYHTNSGEIQKNSSVPTTSYFSIIYY